MSDERVSRHEELRRAAAQFLGENPDMPPLVGVAKAMPRQPLDAATPEGLEFCVRHVIAAAQQLQWFHSAVILNQRDLGPNAWPVLRATLMDLIEAGDVVHETDGFVEVDPSTPTA